MHECSKVNNSTEHTKNAALKRNLDSHVISYLLSSLFQFYSHFCVCFCFAYDYAKYEAKKPRKNSWRSNPKTLQPK